MNYADPKRTPARFSFKCRKRQCEQMDYKCRAAVVDECSKENCPLEKR